MGWCRRTALPLLLVAGLPLAATGALAQPEMYSARSFTGQFLVQVAPGAGLSFLPSNLETNSSFIRLDPTLVPVSCERIKQIIWRELDTKPPYNGTVFLTIYPARAAEQPIAVQAQPFSDGWEYRVMLPSPIERVRYVRTIVQMVLLELANRAATARTAEVPLWLIEGMTQELLASSEMEIILPPPGAPANHIRLTYVGMDARRPNPLERAHRILSASKPLTFQQLSWPSPEQLNGAAAEIYSSSAQLFCHQLLQLHEGGACLRTMLAELSEHYNWQFAFLRAFQSQFSRPIAVEKWWSLEVVHFTGRELAEDSWSPDQGWQKLRDTIHPAVQVRTGAGEMPLTTEVSLQTILRDWDGTRQSTALGERLRELQLLRLRLTRELVPLVDGYRQTLAAYLQERQRKGIPFLRSRPSRQQVGQAAINQLDALDARLEALRPAAAAPVQAGVQHVSS